MLRSWLHFDLNRVIYTMAWCQYLRKDAEELRIRGWDVATAIGFDVCLCGGTIAEFLWPGFEGLTVGVTSRGGSPSV